MCNFSQGIKKAGMPAGIAEATLQYVRRLMQVSNNSVEEIMNLLDVNEDMRPVILKSLKQ